MSFRPTLLALFAVLAFALGACATEMAPIADARASYFSTVDGNDADCEGWLDWCIDQGYDQAACEARNEYCVDGQWVGDRGDDDQNDDPCEDVARQAERDCIESGGTREECREVYADAYDDCTSR